MSKLYMYVVDRDFGFAPNPFHGYCTLATCKPVIRRAAEVGDWVIGIGGSRLKATGRCVFAMCITEKITFDQYWSRPQFFDKKPVRNGSRKMMVGDNIYHTDSESGRWCQADSHHSNPDGSVNEENLKRDTGNTNKVLISECFYYFGTKAPEVPKDVLAALRYKNQPGHRVYSGDDGNSIMEWLEHAYMGSLNRVVGDPFDFEFSGKRYSVATNKVS